MENLIWNTIMLFFIAIIIGLSIWMASLAVSLIKLAITEYSELDRKDIAACCVGGVFGLFGLLVGLLIVICLVFDLHIFR